MGDNKQKLTYLDNLFSEKDLIVYRAIHEIAHIIYLHLLDQNNATLLSLSDTIYDIRKNTKNKGLSSLGSLDKYKAKGLANGNGPYKYGTREDIVELLSIYIYNQDYFQGYLTMLSTPTNFKNNSGLVTIWNSLKRRIETSIKLLIDGI